MISTTTTVRRKRENQPRGSKVRHGMYCVYNSSTYSVRYLKALFTAASHTPVMSTDINITTTTTVVGCADNTDSIVTTP